MNYEIIKDEKLLIDFIDWLPDLEPYEKYYLCLFARSKYLKDENGINLLPHIKSDKSQLKRFVSDKERMFQKIKQLEIGVGWYKQKESSVPQESLALYITPSPRNMSKATVNTMIKLAQSIRDQNININPHQEAMSEIQKAKSRTCWIDFDIDKLEVDLIGNVMDLIPLYINMDATKILKTRGGYHLLVDPNKVEQKYKSSFYKDLLQFADQAGDNMIPVPGCVQGNFIPHFTN